MFSDEHILIGLASMVGFVWLKTAYQQLPPTRIRAMATASIGVFCILNSVNWFMANRPIGSVVAMAMIGISFVLVTAFIWKRIPSSPE